MKLSHFIPPAIALISIGSWIGPQRLSMAAVKAECARLQTSIATAKSPSPTKHDPLDKRRETIEWTKLAAHFPSNLMMRSIRWESFDSTTRWIAAENLTPQ